MQMPTDSVILLSVANMKLRDFYSDAESMCEDLEWNKEELIQRLKSIKYEYNKDINQFVQR